MPDIEGALFDMDGLLLDTERVGQEAFVTGLAPMGVSAAKARDVFLHMIGGNAEANHATLAEHLPGLEPSGVRDAWVAAFEDGIAHGVPLRPTVRETITALSDAGWQMAVVTSSIRAHAEHNLGQTGLLPLFRSLVTADDVSALKPDPEPYLTGAARLGLPPEACAAFEDSDPGITAAMAAGCVATQIPDLRPPKQEFPKLGQRFATTLAEAVSSLGLLSEEQRSA